MPKFIDRTGQKYGHLTVVEKVTGPQYGVAYWSCICDCGKSTVVTGNNLNSGQTKSCGCLCTKKRNGHVNPNWNDLSGRVFKKWTVLSDAGLDKHRQGQWLCRCECGFEKIVLARHLIPGQSEGCWRCQNTYKGTAVRNLFCQYKNGAKQRDLVFEISLETFIQITSSPCFYCGAPPSKKSKSVGGETYIYNGVDRIDNEVGYVDLNVAPCCHRCNWMKHHLPLNEFLAHVKGILDHCSLVKKS